MSKYCRLCACKSIDFIKIFDRAGHKLNINEIISKHFWFEVNENDNFSNYICTKCWNHLQDFNNFYKQIELAQNDLNQTMLKSEPHSNNPETGSNSGDDVSNDQTNECTKMDFSTKLENATDEEDEQKDDQEQEEEEEEDQREQDDAEEDEDDEEEEEAEEEENNKRKPRYKTRRQFKKSEYKIATENALKMKKQEEQEKRLAEDKKILDFFKLKCELCNETAETFVKLNIHYRQKHSIKFGYIICCNKKLIRRCSVLEHLEWHLNPDEFRCNICSKVYSDRYCLKLHMGHHASEDLKKFKCDICGKGFVKKGQLSHHLSISHLSEEKRKHKCDECGKGFALFSILSDHKRRVHEFAYTTVCDICAKIFKSKSQCDIHRREQHSKEERQQVQCAICAALLKNKVTLYCHMKRIHNDTPKKCDLCDKVCPNRDALQNHKRYVHTLKRLLKCNFCDKSFKQPISLREHQASHTGEILYVCPYCPKTFNSNANMHSHRKNKHPDEWLRDRKSRRGPIKME